MIRSHTCSHPWRWLHLLALISAVLSVDFPRFSEVVCLFLVSDNSLNRSVVIELPEKLFNNSNVVL